MDRACFPNGGVPDQLDPGDDEIFREHQVFGIARLDKVGLVQQNEFTPAISHSEDHKAVGVPGCRAIGHHQKKQFFQCQ
jgi:hypothetical protein